MATELGTSAIKVYLLFQGLLPFNLRENNLTLDDEVDLVLLDNSTEPTNIVTLENNATQLTRGNVVTQNVPHNLENIPVGDFMRNRGLADDFLHIHDDAEEYRSNLGQESDELLDLPERQSNSSNANADNIVQNDDNTSETEIVDSLQEDHNSNDAVVADDDDDDDDDDSDPSSSETDDEFDDNNSDFDSDDSDFHDLIEVRFILIVLW